MNRPILILFLLVLPAIALAQTPTPTCASDNHKAFDFWVGEWAVSNSDGSLAGTNKITKVHNSCVIKEAWTSANKGFTGTSLNFYNPKKNQWQQLWLDSSGSNLELTGNRKGNQMILRTEDAKTKDGNSYFHQLTWTKNEDGSVRQLWETKTGDKVTIVFDGLYNKITEK